MLTNEQELLSSLIESVSEEFEAGATTQEEEKVAIQTIAVDAEWHSKLKQSLEKADCWIDDSKQVSVQYYHRQSGREVIYVQEDYYVRLSPFAETLGIELIPWIDLDRGTLEDLLYRLGLKNQEIRLLLFYSPKDLRFSLGKSQMEYYYLDNRIVKKRGIKNRRGALIIGENCQIKIHDLAGWAPRGLADLAAAVGVEMTDKHELDSYKWRMGDAVQELPEVFLRYAMGDTTALIGIFEKYVLLAKKVQRILGLPEEELFTEETIPQTNGTIVAKTLNLYIRNQASNKKAFDYAVRKHGILNSDHKGYRKYRDILLKLRQEVHTGEDLERKGIQKELKALCNSRAFLHTVIGQAGVQYFAKQQDSSVYLSIVQGGRCNNELPTEYAIRGAALDIDMSSCYGSALRSYIYPIGLPTVLCQYDEEKSMTLREFLARYKSELVDNLWEVVVRGELPFRQDLVFSKAVSAEKIRKLKAEDYEKGDGVAHRTDVSHIPGDFLLCQMQIENGIITTEILETLEKVSTNQERQELLNLEIQSAVFYAKSDRLSSMDEWVEHILQDEGERTVVGHRHGNNKDDRSRKWYGMSMEGFMGKLVDERKRAKTDGEKAYQEMLKTFINTTYGVIASPYFEIGNVVLANNITARARLGAWMMNKSLHTVQSITDGGGYSPLRVAVLKPNAKLPGFDKLSNNNEWKDTKNYTRTTAALEGLPEGVTWIDWVQEVEEAYKTLQDATTRTQYEKQLGLFLDDAAKKQIDKFWERYGLTFPFAIEHKVQNIATAMAYLKKGDYGFRTVASGDVFRSRGNKDFRQAKGPNAELKSHPTYQWLTNILDGSDEVPESMDYNKKYLLSIGVYTRASTSKNGFKHLLECHPGDEIIETQLARFNNTHIQILNLEQYKTRNNRKTANHGKPTEFFERFRNRGTTAVVRAMNADFLP
ncbi:MAG: hypothetical protein KME10_24905 [Plectolyngbya sp. WJT66-NPBG17]|jgi:hypothetical protein|nr:hypothetical protein [Plectolyngbya sp. WJT66-NPBG17]